MQGMKHSGWMTRSWTGLQQMKALNLESAAGEGKGEGSCYFAELKTQMSRVGSHVDHPQLERVLLHQVELAKVSSFEPLFVALDLSLEYAGPDRPPSPKSHQQRHSRTLPWLVSAQGYLNRSSCLLSLDRWSGSKRGARENKNTERKSSCGGSMSNNCLGS